VKLLDENTPAASAADTIFRIEDMRRNVEVEARLKLKAEFLKQTAEGGPAKVKVMFKGEQAEVEIWMAEQARDLLELGYQEVTRQDRSFWDALGVKR
jgi:hypothetical protein